MESLALAIFKAHGVDLHTATYYTLARTRTHGLAGFCEGVELLAAMISHDWDKFWPQDESARTGMLDWLNSRTGNILRQQLSFSGADLPLLYRTERALQLICDKLQQVELKRQPHVENLLYFVQNTRKRLEPPPKSSVDIPPQTTVRTLIYAPESTQPVTEENLPPLPELPEMKVAVHHGAVEDPEPVARATSGRTIKGFMAGVVCAAAVAAVLWWWQVYPMQQQLAQVRDTAQGAATLWLASPELDSYGQRLQQLPDASPLQLLETGMQMMRTADSHWPESLQQQQATAQWNEILKTRAQSSPQITQWEYIYKNNWIRWITPNIKWTRYLFNNPQIMKFGVGAAAMTEGIVKGTRYSVLFSGAFHVLEFIFKSEYDFADFFVDVSMDVAKLMVAQIVLKAVAGILDFLALR